MQFAASFIEYLVTGTLALLWLIPLSRTLWPRAGNVLPTDLGTLTIWAPILLGFVYVIGLLLDFIAYKLIRGKRKGIREEQEALDVRYKDALKSRGIKSLDDNAFIWYKSPELAKAVAAYSSRDRMARGATLNFAIATIVVPLVVWSYPASLVVAGGCLALACIAYFAWVRYQSLSREFKKKAVIVILERGNSSASVAGQSAMNAS